MKFFRISFIVLLSILPAGCLYTVEKGRATVQTDASEALDYRLDEVGPVTVYGGYIAGLSPSDRFAECGRLVRGEAGDNASLPIQLRTALVMMLTPECGGPEKALVILERVREKILQTEVRNLVRYQLALANCMIRQSEQSEDLEQRVAALGTSTESLRKQLKLKDDELQQLRATLDALKEIEKTFHERNESGVP